MRKGNAVVEQGSHKKDIAVVADIGQLPERGPEELGARFLHV